MNYSALSFVLHRRPYRETSALVDIFTSEFGKISVVAKGIQRPKNSWRGLLQPFTPIQITFTGKRELKTLVHVESIEPPFKLIGERSYCGFYVNELLSRGLAKEESMKHLFDSYRQTLAALVGEPIEPTLRQFEWSMLQELGFGIDFYHDCLSGEEIKQEKRYIFVPEQGFIPVLDGQSEKRSFSGEVLYNLRDGIWDKAALKMAKYLFRIGLKSVIGDKPLKSKELFRSST